MSYTQQEDFGGAMQDRQLSILTTANIVGAFIGAVAVWQLLTLLHLHLPWFAQYGVILVLGGGTGIALTMRWEGVSLLDTLTLWAGWRMRLLLNQTALHPQAAPVAYGEGETLALYDGNEVLVRPYDPANYPQETTDA